MAGILLKRGEETKNFNLDEKSTWISYDSEQYNQQYCCVDILVLTIGKDKYRSRVAREGRKVISSLVKPICFDYERLRISNETNSAFNENTHKDTAFKKALRDTRKAMDKKKGEEIIGEYISTPLPFRCEEIFVEWVVQGRPNHDKVIMRNIEGQQLFYILSMTFMSVEKLEDDEKQASMYIY